MIDLLFVLLLLVAPVMLDPTCRERHTSLPHDEFIEGEL
jgi:hypothetical protein